MRAPPGVGRPGLRVLRGGGTCHSKETGTGAGLRGGVQTRQAGLQSSKSLWSWGRGVAFPRGTAGRSWESLAHLCPRPCTGRTGWGDLGNLAQAGGRGGCSPDFLLLLCFLWPFLFQCWAFSQLHPLPLSALVSSFLPTLPLLSPLSSPLPLSLISSV